jgi:Lysylphosphatidylglycerol synthase TM region
LAACIFLYVRFSGHRAHHEAVFAWFSRPMVPWSTLAVVALLMLVNWGIESWKWRILVRDVEPVTVGRAFTAVIAGTSIGLITPNRVGEFAGRVLFLRPEHRVQGSFATLLGSIAQFVVTVLAGTAVLFLMPYEGRSLEQGALWQLVRWCALLVGAATVFLYFSPGALERVFLAIPWLRRYERHVHVLAAFDRSRLITVAAWSGLRYLVFTIQFVLVLNVVGTVPVTVAIASVPVVFLVSTLIPTTALTELGVRGSLAESLIAGGEPVGVVISTIIIWVVNIVIPAVFGSLILLVARIRTSEEAA